MDELDIVRSWDGGCWWGAKRRYPDKPAFLAAVEADMYPDEEDVPLSPDDVTETRLRHCVGDGCGENGGGHWHPTENKRAAPVWQYGKEG